MNMIKSFLKSIFGSLIWSPPTWLTRVLSPAINFKKKSPRSFFLFVSSLILLVVAGFAARHWYLTRPHPHYVTVTNPGVTPYDSKKLLPYNAILDFSESAAKIEEISKPIKTGLTVRPEVEGTWSWNTDKQLLFVPKNDWPAGQKYRVDFARDFFPPHLLLKELSYEFNSPDFGMDLTDFSFYQDLTAPKIKKAVATLRFTHPVGVNDLKNSVRLEEQMGKDTALVSREIAHTITFDKHKREAYIHSENLTPKEQLSYIELTVAKGVSPQNGPGRLSAEFRQKLTIPGIHEFFRVEKTATQIRTDENGAPEQVLIIHTRDGVTSADLLKNLRVHLLPEEKPSAYPLSKKDLRKWTGPAEVTPDVLQKSIRVKLRGLPSTETHSKLHSFVFKEPPGRYLHVNVRKGLKSFGDYTLNQDYTGVLKTPHYPEELAFLSRGAMLSLAGEKKVGFVTRALDKVELKIYRVLPGRIQDLAALAEGDFQEPQFYSYSFNEENISEVSREIRPVDNRDPSRAQYHVIDMSKHTGPERGLFILALEHWSRGHEYVLKEDRRLMLVTDLGVFVKRGAGGARDVFVHSLSSGSPMAGAHVSVLAKNGLVVADAQTDERGRAPLKNLEALKQELSPVALVVKSKDDLTFLPFERADREIVYSNADTWGVFLGGAEKLQAHVFSDRGIYRPGEKGHAGVIVRSTDFERTVSGIPLEIVIKDPRDLPIKKEKLLVPASGYFDVGFQTAENAIAGTYNINVYVIHDKKEPEYIGSTSIRVEEFLPDQMKIKTEFSKKTSKGWVSPEELDGLVDLKNLYGTPATERSVKGSIALSQAQPYFESFSDYRFYNPLKLEKEIQEKLGEAKTDANGKASFDLGLDRFAKATYRLVFSAEGFAAAGGRSVASSSSVLVSPLKFLVGHKTQSELGFLHLNSRHRINLIAVNPDLKAINAPTLKSQIIDNRHVSTLIQQNDGTFKYQSVLTEKIVSENPLAISENGTVLDLPTGRAGDFELRMFDADDNRILQVAFTVAGQANLTRSLDRAAELKMNLNKDVFQPGEEIEISIKAPYDGFGLITLERDRVFAHKWFKASTTASIQTIGLPSDFEGNGYVSVAFVRDTKSPEIFMSPLSFNTVPFSADLAHRREPVELEVPELVLPGKDLSISYKTGHPAKIVVFAVDEGILQFAGYPTPDPLAFLFRKRALEVRTSQTLDLLLPEYSLYKNLAGIGGDQAYNFVGNNINPFKRKTEPPVAFWSGVVDAGAGPQEILFKIPESFYGKLRVMAVAVTNTGIGVVKKETTVRGPFVLSPNAPLFVAPGDEFEVSVTVANNIEGSGDSAAITLSATTGMGLETVGTASKTMTLAENSETSTSFKFKAQTRPGPSEIRFEARHKKTVSSNRTTLSIRPATPKQTTIMSGHFKGGKIRLEPSRKIHDEEGTNSISLSVSPDIFLFGLKDYLDNFEFSCTEQLVSQAFSALVSLHRISFQSEQEKAQKMLEKIFSNLRSRQTADGSFVYWPQQFSEEDDEGNAPDSLADSDDDTPSVDEFASLYAVHFLIESRELGQTVPQDMLERSLTYLKDFLSYPITSNEQAELYAYGTYLLTRAGQVTAGQLANLRDYLEHNVPDWQKNIPGAYIAATYSLLKFETEAAALIQKYEWQDEKALSKTVFYTNPNLSNMRYLWLVSQHFPKNLSSLKTEDLLAITNFIAKNRYNTLLAASSTLALHAYSHARKPDNLHATFAVSEVSGSASPKTIQQESSRMKHLNLPFSKNASALELTAKGEGPFFYQITQSGFDASPPQKAERRGVEILRELRDTKGKVVFSAVTGDDIEVHLTLRSLTGHWIDDVVVIDLLPGGFDVGDDPSLRQARSLSSSSQDWRPDFADIREDRVLLFGNIGPDARKFVYRIKAVSPGNFTVPPALVRSMYDLDLWASGKAGTFTVKNR